MVRKPRIRVVLVLAATLIVALVFVGRFVSSRIVNEVVVCNYSGQQVRMMTVSLGGSEIYFSDIPDDSEVRARLPYFAVAFFHFKVTFADGREIEGDLGMDGGFDRRMFGWRWTFTLAPNGEINAGGALRRDLISDNQ